MSERKWKLVRILLEGGIEVERTRALHVAVRFVSKRNSADYNFIKVITFLLAHGGDPNRQDTKGRTAIMFALRRRLSEQVVTLLLKHGPTRTLTVTLHLLQVLAKMLVLPRYTYSIRN